ncbi:MAG: putative undecaprenyl phosphate N-acetylglucosaminyltransferase [Proteobacteria bacterium]|jgi:UDP-N-acetylmuramyl pentapeptide phosphotransferase/UDP-N-acetylglucosamine-1-phosphate transferase|nr:putative undecaprenyl phosphate N-acetylglucosaminyltransferase [Pseudomonadota bacterium]
MLILVVAFAVSLVATLVAIRSARTFAYLKNDKDQSGPQTFHAQPAARIGGLGIVAGMLAGVTVIWHTDRSIGAAGFVLLGCGLPAWVAGLAEDLTNDVSPRRRLLSSALSALLGVWLLDAVIVRTAIPGLDWVVSFPLGAAALSVFVVTGVANAVNIIDGFNGLASMCGVLILLSLSYVGFQVDDLMIAWLALAGVGALLGFFVWNFPAGLIFLGDGGAYFLGFYIAELSILLLHRNPTVSPMFPLLLCIYPVFETVFSIYRRRFLRAMPPSMPDGIHLHSLIYRRVMRWAVGNRSAKALTRRNSMTSPYLWLLCMFAAIPSVLFWDNTAVLSVLIVLFGVSYVVLYWRIVRFKSPRWLVFRR